MLYALADLINAPDDLVARNDRRFVQREIALNNVNVSPADRASHYGHSHLTRAGLRLWYLGQSQWRFFDRLLLRQKHCAHPWTEAALCQFIDAKNRGEREIACR